jgi:RNAse (barnase) inhibitor barstar
LYEKYKRLNTKTLHTINQVSMKKDIPQYKVEDLAIAIVPRENGLEEEDLWDTFILNLRDEPIKIVFVNSKGYG